MKAAYRCLPYCYLALALVCGLSVCGALWNLVTAFKTHDEDALTPSELVPLFLFVGFGVAFFIVFIVNAVLLFRRQQRKQSIVLSWITCLAFPFGTPIGAVSVFLLTRDEIRSEYSQ